MLCDQQKECYLDNDKYYLCQKNPNHRFWIACLQSNGSLCVWIRQGC